MICFTTNQPGFFNDLADVVRLFFGMEKISPLSEDAEFLITHTFFEAGGKWIERCEISGGGKPPAAKELVFEPVASDDRLYVDRLKKRYAKLCLYALLKEQMGFKPPWGSLTGIRPTRLARQLIEEGRSYPQVVEALQSVFDVSAQKAKLVGDILNAQEGIYGWGDEGHFDVYVGIPFCRTRCLYCSFFSSDMRKKETVRAYFDALALEIRAFGSFMRDKGKKCRAVYVGGGTPVAVDTGLLRGVLEEILGAFPGALEFTVEAGRPDCVSEENMRMLRELGVGRVSVNPQTMNARTLEAIGRGHTPQDVLNAYALARRSGIPQINMDLIVGLPGEGIEDVCATLDALSPLDMDNLTVHTLAIKHSSRLNERLLDYPLPDADAACAMLNLAQEFASSRGMRPYYMYRQKYMAGNLENVGYALPGTECVYNVDMMDETHDILAFGAGAVSKRMFYAETRYERYSNPKNIEYYVKGIDELIKGKMEFYSK